MILPWDRELSAYDTFDKLITLGDALEINVRQHEWVYNFHVKYNHEKVDDPGYIPIDQKDLYESCIDSMRIAIYEAICVRREKRKLEKLIQGDDAKHWFVTVGLDDKQFKDDNEALIINPLVKKLVDTPGIENVKFVVEKFRKNDKNEIYIHRHIHFVFESNMRKSKIVQYFFQKAKKYVAAQNFIDVKPDPFCDRHKYVAGDKAPHKLECVEKDRSWRKEKNIIEM